MTHLEKLREATKSLKPEMRESFRNFFIGSLAVVVDEENWDRALNVAKKAYKIEGDENGKS